MDVAGHYNRPDLFRLTVNRETAPQLRLLPDGDDAGQMGDAPADR